MDSRSHLKERLDLKIQQHHIVPPGLLPQLCSVEDIRTVLGLEDSDGRPGAIFKSALKLFSILTRLDKASVILKCLEGDLGDQWAFDYNRESPFCTDEHLRGTALEGIGELLLEQWRFPPPLSREVHYGFPPTFLQVFELNRAEQLDGGGYGAIYRHTFRPGQLTDCDQGGVFAVKRVVQKTDASLVDLRRESNIIRKYRHEALTPLLASFEVLSGDDGRHENLLFLVLPLAHGGNMEDWIHETSPPSFLRARTSAQRQEYLLGQVQSLYGALAFLHTPETEEDHIVLHFDLRPRNLLLFTQGPRPDPVWKISDFGIARLATVSQRLETNAAHEYAPPEALGPGSTLERHGREFDVFSMACIALQLLTLACRGWNDAIQEFDVHRQGETDDRSFGRCKAQLHVWIQGLRTSQASKEEHANVIAQTLSLLQDSLENVPQQRPMAWEIPVYMMLASERAHGIRSPPHQLSAELRKMIPRATVAEGPIASGLLARARSNGGSELWKVVKEKQWTATSKPRLPQYDSDEGAENYKCHLPGEFRGNRLVGDAPKSILGAVDLGFANPSNSRSIGLWGLGGMGKSHTAYEYACRFRKNSAMGQRHVLWINASNQSTLDMSCEELKTKLGCNDDLDPLSSIRLWLEDKSKGPWILVLDGLDQLANAQRWFSRLPQAKHGMTIITTRDRDVLQRFTGFHPEQTIEVGPLPVEDARKVFNGVIQGHASRYEPTENQFRKLYSFLLTPLFVKLAAFYIIRGQGGNAVIEELVGNLARDSTHIGHLDPEGKVRSQEDRQMKTFSVFLHPFDVTHAPGSEEFVLLGTVACFASNDISLDVLAGLCVGQQQESRMTARRYLDEYASYGFVTSQDPELGKYTMHALVSHFILRSITHNARSEKAAMVCFRWMLDRIWRMYTDTKPPLDPAGDLPLRRDSYLHKLPFLGHFEQFSRYVQYLKKKRGDGHWRVQGLTFRPYTARSIVAFCQALASQSRTDDAIDMLRFVVDHDMVPRSDREKDIADMSRAKIRVLNSLAARLEDKRPVVDKNKFLDEALSHARSGLELAKFADFPDLVWRLSLQIIRILTRLGRFGEAAQKMREFRSDLGRLQLPGTDDYKAVLDTEKLLASLFLDYARARGDEQFVAGASKIYRGLIEWLQVNRRRETVALDTVRGSLAALLLLLNVSDAALVEEARAIYASILENSRTHGDDTRLRREVVDDEVNLARALVRQSKLQEAAAALQPVFDMVLNQLGPVDELTGSVASALADIYDRTGDQAAAQSIRSKSQVSTIPPASMDAKLPRIDPRAACIQDIKSHRVDYGSGSLTMSTTEDALLDLILKHETRAKETMPTFWRNISSVIHVWHLLFTVSFSLLLGYFMKDNSSS